MPGIPPARSGSARNELTATIYANRGWTEPQIAQALLELKRGISEFAAGALAQRAIANAENAAQINARLLLGDDQGQLAENVVHTERKDVTVDVTIPQTDGTVKIRSIRVTIEPGMTDLDFSNEVNSVISDKFAKYPGDDTGIHWQVRTILTIRP